MLDIIRKVWRVGTVTKRQPFSVKPPMRFRGSIAIKDIPETNWADCAAICPTNAFIVNENVIGINYGRCIFCGECARICKTDGVVQTNNDIYYINKKEKLYLLLNIR